MVIRLQISIPDYVTQFTVAASIPTKPVARVEVEVGRPFSDASGGRRRIADRRGAADNRDPVLAQLGPMASCRTTGKPHQRQHRLSAAVF